MDNAIAVKEPEQISIADVKKYIAPNATDKELFMFMGICKSYGLNPLKREIHFVKYGNVAASIIVGYEIYLKRAERTGKLDGWKCWIEGDKAVIEIKRKDQSIPIRWEVDRKEFDKAQSTWKTMPNFMLKKVAIAQGFRLAFPDELGGLPYLAEELPQTAKLSSEELPKEAVVVNTEQDVPDVAPPEVTPDRYPEEPPKLITLEQQTTLNGIIIDKGVDQEKFLKYMGVASLEEIQAKDYKKAIESLKLAKGNKAA
jgi:hypothetical protein